MFRRKSTFLLAAIALLMVLLASCVSHIVSMPGTSFTGVPPALTTDEQRLAEQLKRDVLHLASTIGERNLTNAPTKLIETASWLRAELTDAGYTPSTQPYQVGTATVENIIVERKGTLAPDQLIIIGAHYDSAEGTPGADDNASGVATVLALARSHATDSFERTVRFVFFTNEEPPYFRSDQMGSDVYAKSVRAKNEDVRAMLSVETVGYFTDEASTQHYPFPFSLFYPSSGNFIAFVGDQESRELVRDTVERFRSVAQVPSEGAALPRRIQGADWSDHGPFWRAEYRALMVTDTAVFRNPHYHEPTDTPEKLDYVKMSRVTRGLSSTLRALATTPKTQ